MKKTTLEDLRRMLVLAQAREFDPDWIVRMQARKDVETLKRRVVAAERQEGKAARLQNEEK